ncbi:hypothetical protein Tco_1491151 [Tanacetum coccineum]
MGRDQVFTFNLHHDGIFSPNPLKYIQGDEKQITNINFKEANGIISSGSSDEYYSSDKCEEIEGVDFHIEGEENVSTNQVFPWWASWMRTKHSFQIKYLHAEHKYGRNYKLGSLVNYKWIAYHFAKEIINDPFIPYLGIKSQIREKFLTDVSIGQCRRAKQRALYNYEGWLIEHYGRLWDYRQALLESNPGSTCRLDVED